MIGLLRLRSMFQYHKIKVSPIAIVQRAPIIFLLTIPQAKQDLLLTTSPPTLQTL